MAAASEERMVEEGGGGHGDGGSPSAIASTQRLPPPPPSQPPQPGSQAPPAPALAPDQLPQNNTLVALPIVAIENILSFMSYDEISQLRLVALVVKNPHASAGDIADTDLIPEQEDSLEEGMANPLQYSCLENPMDGGAWQATVWGHKESDTTEAT